MGEKENPAQYYELGKRSEANNEKSIDFTPKNLCLFAFYAPPALRPVIDSERANNEKHKFQFEIVIGKKLFMMLFL